MVRTGLRKNPSQATQFARRDISARLFRYASVDAYEEPVRMPIGRAIVKLRFPQFLGHQRSNIVIARNAIYRQVERAKHCTNTPISVTRVVLYEIAG
jgi:hypothetical protein